MNRLISALTTGLHERDEAVRLGLLVSMAGESMFMLGPPGVGKSLVARRLQMVFADARSFSYLMGRFSTPDEVFGPLSIRRLKQDDRYERVTSNYLPEADVVFLDEIWKASAPIRNALLTALNERLYRNGSQEVELPLKVFIGASNELPEDDETAAAFWDRFLVRLVLAPISGTDAFLSLISDTRDVYDDVIDDADKITTKEYDEFQAALTNVAVPDGIGTLLVDIRARLRSADVSVNAVVSDRRWKKIVHLLRASALLHERQDISALDCAIIRHCVWNRAEDRDLVDQIVRDALAAHTVNPTLLESFSSARRELEQQHLDRIVEVSEDEVTEPVMYREEYYRLVQSGAGASDGTGRTLVWHGDIDDLATDLPSNLDVFSYDANDQLVESVQVEARRIASWRIEIAGEEWEIETERTIGTTTSSRDLTSEERAELTGKVAKLLGDIRAAIERVGAARDETENDARAHLFVPVDYARIVTEAAERSVEELVRIRLETEQLLDSISASP